MSKDILSLTAKDINFLVEVTNEMNASFAKNEKQIKKSKESIQQYNKQISEAKEQITKLSSTQGFHNNEIKSTISNLKNLEQARAKDQKTLAVSIKSNQKYKEGLENNTKLLAKYFDINEKSLTQSSIQEDRVRKLYKAQKDLESVISQSLKNKEINVKVSDKYFKQLELNLRKQVQIRKLSKEERKELEAKINTIDSLRNAYNKLGSETHNKEAVAEFIKNNYQKVILEVEGSLEDVPSGFEKWIGSSLKSVADFDFTSLFGGTPKKTSIGTGEGKGKEASDEGKGKEDSKKPDMGGDYMNAIAKLLSEIKPEDFKNIDSIWEGIGTLFKGIDKKTEEILNSEEFNSNWDKALEERRAQLEGNIKPPEGGNTGGGDNKKPEEGKEKGDEVEKIKEIEGAKESEETINSNQSLIVSLKEEVELKAFCMRKSSWVGRNIFGKEGCKKYIQKEDTTAIAQSCPIKVEIK